MLFSSREPALFAGFEEGRRAHNLGGSRRALRGWHRGRAGPVPFPEGRAGTYLWAAPASLVGLVFAPFFERRYVVRGALLVEGARWPGRLGWRYRAITFGHVILGIDTLDRATLEHELRHVRQYERWGLLFFPAYALASLRARLAGGHFYRDNAFELAARRTDDAGL